MSADRPQEVHARIVERLAQEIRRRAVRRIDEVDDLPATGAGEPGPSVALDDGASAAEREWVTGLRDAVETLERNYVVAAASASPRRFGGGLVNRLRSATYRLLRPFFEQQGAFNAADARATAQLTEYALAHAAKLRELEVRLAASERSPNRQVEDLENTIRFLTREIEQVTNVDRIAVDYLDLTNAFRGSEEAIRDRQRPYLAWFEGRTDIVDLGCGRGEFLELLGEAGVAAVGIDADSATVDYCRRKGLDVLRRDALTYLDEAPANSLGGIFGAQLIEHLLPGELTRLVRLAHRVLRPDGVLVLETVNPECLAMFASFYLDLTHVRPYHAELLKWLLAQQGFVDVEVRYASPANLAQRGPNSDADSSEWPLSMIDGYLEYAVIGRKSAPEAV